MQYPLLYLSIAFCLGIIAAAYQKAAFFVLCLLMLLSLIFSIFSMRQLKKFNAAIILAVFFLGAALLRNSQALPNNHIVKLLGAKSEAVSLIGVVVSDPIYQAEKASFILKLESLEVNHAWQQACGRLLVRIFKGKGFAYGDRIFLSGKLYRPFSFSRDFNFKQFLKRQGIYCILSVKKDSTIKRLAKNTGNPLKLLAFKIKHRLREVIVKNLSCFSAGILNALILGDRQDLSSYLLDILMKLGTIHIIAISGFNVGIVAFIILITLKIAKIPRKPRYIITILLLVVYCILTGLSAPVVRATVMAVILLCAYLFERQANIYNSLSLATFVILSFNPWQLFEISFQLSFLSVISIVWLAPKIHSIFSERFIKKWWLRFPSLIFSASTAAWLGLLPMIAYYFKVFTPITVLANMIIVPYSAVITVSGFSLTLIGTLVPSLVPIFASANELLILILFKINYFLAAIPGAYFKLPDVPFMFVLFYYIILIVFFSLICGNRLKSQGEYR